MLQNLFGQQNHAFGLEIGNSSVKVFQLKKIEKKYKIIGFKREKLPKGAVENEEIKNKDAVVTAIINALKNSKPQKIKTKNVVVSLPESKTFTKTFEVPKLPKEKLDLLIKSEIEKYIPLSPNELYIDWQVICSTSNTLTVFLAAGLKSYIDTLQNVLQQANLEPIIFDLETVAETKSIIPKSRENQATAIIDIGETKTIFIIYDNNTIPFATTVANVSGRAFTQNIAKTLEINEKEAEKLKITCCSPKMTEQERKTLTSLHIVLDKLALEINRGMNYYHAHHEKSQKIEEILVCGGGSGIIGIAKYLSLKLRKRVKLSNSLVNVQLINFSDITLIESLSSAKVIGLALRAANL